jgi:hypothetical protein
MPSIFRCFLCFIALTTTIFAEQLNLPPGYVLENLSIDDFGEEDYYDDLLPKGSVEDNEEFATEIMATIEGLPSSVVAGCVNAVTGHFFDSQIDMTVPGPTPITVQRSWSSADKKWNFGHMPELRVGKSRGRNHILAGYSDDNGMGLMFSSWILRRQNDDYCTLTIPEKAYKKGLTNCGLGEISGQTNWNNSKLIFVRKDKEKRYLLRYPSFTDRIFTQKLCLEFSIFLTGSYEINETFKV